ncbi:MAG: hypothetical protein ACOYO0_04110 [Sandarakinorhabdus sp.]
MMKVLSVSRGGLASALAVDKSLVSRWLSGATLPSDPNLARLTIYVARTFPHFTMLDWEADAAHLAARLGITDSLDDIHAPSMPSSSRQDHRQDPPHPIDLPAFARLPAFATAIHETAARGQRYCGLWRAWMPTFGRPDAFHCEHTVLWQDGAWLSGVAVGVSYRWPLVGLIANGQLLLIMSDTSDLVFRQYNRADEPIIDQVDGLMLAAASLPHQAPTASRVVMARLLPPEANRDDIEAALASHAAERRIMTADELPPGLLADLLPDTGAMASQSGGERLLRADTTQRLVKTRWF